MASMSSASRVPLKSGVEVNFQLAGPSDAPVVVLSNSLGTDLSLWEPQVDALSARFRVLRYDSRGHGQTSTPPGPYAMTDLAGDVVDLLDELEIETCSFVGISIGGLTGLCLALRKPDRLEKLVVANTAAKIGAPEAWIGRAKVVEESGVASIADAVVEKWLTAEFAADNPEEVMRLRQMLVGCDAAGYAATCLALREADLRDQLPQITVPTLAVGATRDIPTPPDDTQYVAARVKDGKYVQVHAAHISNVEAADEFTQAVLEFLS